MLLRKLKDLSDHEAACIHRKAIIIIRQKGNIRYLFSFEGNKYREYKFTVYIYDFTLIL